MAVWTVATMAGQWAVWRVSTWVVMRVAMRERTGAKLAGEKDAMRVATLVDGKDERTVVAKGEQMAVLKTVTLAWLV